MTATTFYFTVVAVAITIGQKLMMMLLPLPLPQVSMWTPPQRPMLPIPNGKKYKYGCRCLKVCASRCQTIKNYLLPNETTRQVTECLCDILYCGPLLSRFHRIPSISSKQLVFHMSATHILPLFENCKEIFLN